MASETLSVRVSLETRRILDRVAAAKHVGGASSLARDILERVAREMQAELVREHIARLNERLAAEPDADLWGDLTFFPAASDPWE